MRVKILFVFLALLLCYELPSNAQYWIQKGGSATVDESADIAIDNNGNSYTIGYYTGTATFGSTTITSSGSTDIFLVKTNDQGVVQWAVSAGGSGSDKGLSVAVDNSGNPYITGFYNGTASFSTTSLTSAGLQDVFIAKYTTAGALSWAISAGGSNADIGNGIAVDGSGNAAIAGEFQGTSTFGSSSLSSQSGSTDVFIMHVSSTGTVNWVQQGSGANTDRGIDVAFDNSGNVYAAGAFSQNITFDVLHSNTMFNVIFLIKLNSSGVEQWFKVMGGGTSNIVNALTSDSSGNIYATGDFSGTMTFYNSPNTTLSATNTNRVFAVKYTTAGATSWAAANSSENNLTSQAIAADGSGNVYIIGHFKCTHTEFTNAYGDAIFNSIGENDVFVSKFDNTGTWDFAKHFGGSGEDYGYGIDAKTNDQPHICGSFENTMNFPVSADFIASNLTGFINNNCTGNDGYCSDPDYGKFSGMSSAGNADAFFANPVDPDREPYDFYERSGTACNKELINPCIEPGCPDTVVSCVNTNIESVSGECNNIRPVYNYAWNSSTYTGNQNNVWISITGIKWVERTSEDGCFVAHDTIYAEIHPYPQTPIVLDDKGFNTGSSFTNTIEFCSPDSVNISADSLTGSTFQWTGTGISSPITDTTITVSSSGNFTISVTDTNGCSISNSVQVDVYDSLSLFDLESTATDTMNICTGDSLIVWLYDSISNPLGNQYSFDLNVYDFSISVVSPSIVNFVELEHNAEMFFTVDTTTTFTFQVMLVRTTPCETDTHYYDRTVHVIVTESPVIAPFDITVTGNEYICPSDSILLIAENGYNYYWTGSGLGLGYYNDSIYISNAGFYVVHGDTSSVISSGCSASESDTTHVHLKMKESPVITAQNTLICPNSSVTVYVAYNYDVSNQFGDPIFFWEGPNGPIANGNSYAIQVSDPGQYFCVVMDQDSCGLVSNTITLTQYTTPQLSAAVDPFICENDSLEITAITAAGSVIEWQPPLSGNGTSIMVYEPGTYICHITSCGIVTADTVVISPSYVDATITTSGALCTGDTVVLYAPDSMITFNWGPNGETADSILVSENGSFWLSTTDSNGCGTTSDTITIINTQVPTLISITEDTILCYGDTILLSATNGLSTYFWQPTGDSTQNIAVTESGSYTVFTIDTNGCDDFSAAVTLTTPDSSVNSEYSGELYFCEEDSVELSTREDGFASYTWNPGNIDGKSIIVYESGVYQLTVLDTFGCAAQSIPYEVIMEPNIVNTPIGNDTLICTGTHADLSVFTNYGEINWLDSISGEFLGSGSDYMTDPLYENTTYMVWSTLDLCKSDSGFVTVFVQDCETVDVPNIFTPNGDGMNDIFKIKLIESKCFTGYIYNRWGGLLYTINHINEGWDGTVQATGESVPNGTYYYEVDYCKQNGEKARDRGTVTLMRN